MCKRAMGTCVFLILKKDLFSSCKGEILLENSILALLEKVLPCFSSAAEHRFK